MELSLDPIDLSGLTEEELRLYSELREIIPDAILLRGGFNRPASKSESVYTVIKRTYYRGERIESRVYINLEGLDRPGRIELWEYCKKSLTDNFIEYIKWNDFIYNTFAL